MADYGVLFTCPMWSGAGSRVGEDLPHTDSALRDMFANKVFTGRPSAALFPSFTHVSIMMFVNLQDLDLVANIE